MKMAMRNRKDAVVIGLGFELTGLILASLFIGRYFDSLFQTPGFFLIGLSILSLALWIYRMISLFQKKEEKTKNDS